MRAATAALATLVALSPAHASETLNSYLPHLNQAKDWLKIGWYDKALIAKELGSSRGVSKSYNINACLTMVAEDMRSENIMFFAALEYCIKLAKEQK